MDFLRRLIPVLAFAILLSSCTTREEKTREYKSPMVSMENPSSENASLPYLIKGNDGYLYLSWVVKGDSNLATLVYSRLENDVWTEPEVIASGNDWFVNWADYPQIAADKKGNMIAHFLAKSSSGTYSYDVNVVMKPAGSESWSKPVIPHQDGTPTEHGFATLLPNDDNTFTLAWLDGRNTGGGDHGSHGVSDAMTVRSAIMDISGNLSDEVELDNRVCDCCQTTGVRTASETIIMYRDRSEIEIRDIGFVRKGDNKWSEPQRVANDNWEIAGCPVNGPRAAAFGNDFAVAWFTAADTQPKVQVAFSDSDRLSLPLIIDTTSPLGRVDIVMIDNDNAVVSWMDGGDQPAIKWRTVHRNGQMSPEYTIAEISAERGSGFPQMELLDGQLYFAWTEMGDTDQLQLTRIQL